MRYFGFRTLALLAGLAGLALVAGCGGSDPVTTTGGGDQTLEFAPGLYTVRLNIITQDEDCTLLSQIPTSQVVDLCAGDGSGNPIPIEGCDLTVTPNRATFTNCDGNFPLTDPITCNIGFTGSGFVATTDEGFSASITGDFNFGCLAVTCEQTSFVFTGTLDEACPGAARVPVSSGQLLGRLMGTLGS